MKNLWYGLKLAINWLISIQRFIGWACIIAMTGLVTVGSILRYFFDAPLIFTEELVKAIYVILSYVALAAIARSGGHIRVDLFLRFLPRNVRDWVELFGLFMIIVFTSVLFPQAYLLVKRSFDLSLGFETMHYWPKAAFQVPMLVGIILLFLWAIIAFGEQFYETLKKVRGR